MMGLSRQQQQFLAFAVLLFLVGMAVKYTLLPNAYPDAGEAKTEHAAP